MPRDIDIYRSAQLLIDQHAEEAKLHASTRADEFLELGDLDGVATWKRIIRAINELERHAPDGPTH